MNAPIVRLFGLVIVLFGLLVAFTSRWTVFEAEALRDNPNNRRILFEEQRIQAHVESPGAPAGDCDKTALDFTWGARLHDSQLHADRPGCRLQ